MLIDEVDISITGGHGGPGKASFFKKGRGPDGGNGGHGGNIYFETTTDLYALNRYSGQNNFFAAPGEPGGSNKKFGIAGEDLVLTVPVGTEILDLDTHELVPVGLMAKGGIGGQGNDALKRAWMTTPIHAQHGMPGQKRNLRLLLKLIADFGLIGLPNTGKSSILNAITAANAKVGDYQFTTLEPNLGVLNNKVIADIPGLIEGTSEGKGLGIKFLKHIEKVAVLLHTISADSVTPLADYKTVRKELKEYNPALLDKKEIILLTKSDLIDVKTVEKTTKMLKKVAKTIIPLSILDEKSLEVLKKLVK